MTFPSRWISTLLFLIELYQISFATATPFQPFQTLTFGTNYKHKHKHKHKDIQFILSFRGGQQDNTNSTLSSSLSTSLSTSNHTSTLIFPATKEGDGSSTDPEGIPTRFLKMQKQNRPKAKQAYTETLAFRSKHSVDSILSRPHPKYDQCKASISHFFSGRDTLQHPVFVQQFGKIRFDLVKSNSLSADDLILHYVYTLEYCWNILESTVYPDGTEGCMTSILDFEGVGWNTLQDKEFVQFAKRMVSMISSHYPTRSYKTFIINAPRWMGAIYTVFKPLLRKSTRDKIAIFKRGSKEQTTKLQELLGSAYCDDFNHEHDSNNNDDNFINWNTVTGDQLHQPGPYSSIEVELRDICLACLKDHNKTMNTIIV